MAKRRRSKPGDGNELDTPRVVSGICANGNCERYSTVVEFPAGIVLAPGVLLTGTLACMVCGYQIHLAD